MRKERGRERKREVREKKERERERERREKRERAREREERERKREKREKRKYERERALTAERGDTHGDQTRVRNHVAAYHHSGITVVIQHATEERQRERREKRE